MPDLRNLTDRLTERGRLAEQESRFGDASDMQDARAEIEQLRAQLADERAAHAVACQMRDEAATEAADLKSANALLHSLITNRDAEIERLRAQRDEVRTGALEEAAELLHARARNLVCGKGRTNKMDRHTSEVLARARDAVRALIKERRPSEQNGPTTEQAESLLKDAQDALQEDRFKVRPSEHGTP